MTRLCTSPKSAGLEIRLMSRNSEIGLRFAKRELIDVERMLWKRSPKREVMRSTGILNWAIVAEESDGEY